MEIHVIDIHCHILPQVDDGSKSWDMSLEMCRMAAEDGIEHIVATPHANERYEYNRQHLASNLEYLRVLAGQTPRLSLGCDFHLSYDNLQEVLVAPERFTIEDTHYLLVELSNYSIPTQINDYFTKMADVGITPVITHPERNPILQETQQRVLEWVDQGCVVQVTASAVTGGGEARSRAPPSGCWKGMRFTSWLQTLMTPSIASLHSRQPGKKSLNSAATKSPKPWWTTIPAPSSATNRCRSIRIR